MKSENINGYPILYGILKKGVCKNLGYTLNPIVWTMMISPYLIPDKVKVISNRRVLFYKIKN